MRADFESFKKQFVFTPENTLYVGVESEYFLSNGTGLIAPLAKSVLDYLSDKNSQLSKEYGFEPYSYELSACQIEVRTKPVPHQALKNQLDTLETPLVEALDNLNLQRLYTEVGPDDMPLDVYPDPTGRYAQITKTMPKEVLLAACQVIGTHIHVGMPDHETALRVYNKVIPACEELCALGDHSGGRRLDVYSVVEADYAPLPYDSWSDFHQYSVKKGFENDPRQCWTLIRITKHGTLEFRMFGATDNQAELLSWVNRCHGLCSEAMAEL